MEGQSCPRADLRSVIERVNKKSSLHVGWSLISAKKIAYPQQDGHPSCRIIYGNMDRQAIRKLNNRLYLSLSNIWFLSVVFDSDYFFIT